MDALIQDLRYALRGLRRSPGFTAVALCTLALGIGANVLIFSVVDRVLLRPLPYAEPERVVAVWNRWVDFEKTWLSEPELLDYRRAESFEALAAYQTFGANLTGGEEPERVVGGLATPDLFRALGVGASLGRTFVAEEGVPGNDGVALLGHGLWVRRFGADPRMVGRTIRVNGTERTVVGVLPPGFRTPVDFKVADPAELFVPLALSPNPDSLNSRGSHYLYAVGRLRPGATLERANTELGRIVAGLTAEGHYSPQIRFEAFAVPVEDEVLGASRPALWVLVGAVGFVLLIACVNVANLLLVRAEGRRREFAVRVALGAGRRPVLRQLLVEGGTLVLLGAALGVLLAVVGLEVLVALDPGNLPRVAEAAIDGRALAFTAGVAVLCGIAFGLAPALRLSDPDVQRSLKEGGHGATVGRSRLRVRRVLVGAQVVLALVLLLGAGLMMRSFANLLAVDPGFSPRGVLAARLSPPAADYPEPAGVVAFYDRLLERVRALPGVRAAGATRFLPLSGTMGDWTIEIEGREPPPGQDFDGDWQVVTPGYFGAMRIPLVAGRLLDERDRTEADQTIVINERMAREYWPGESALGRRVRFGGSDAPWRTIVGVVGDVRHGELTEERRRTWYVTHAQFPAATGNAIRGMDLVIRAEEDPMALAAPVRAAVRELDARLPVSHVRRLTEVVGTSRAEARFTMVLLLSFAALATILAAVGLYGVMAYAVRQRSQEIGIRVALGARRRDVVRIVIREGLLPVAGGIAIGLAGALALSRLLSGLLYGVAPTDPATFAAAALLFAAVAALACWIPARRAARVDPARVLRAE